MFGTNRMRTILLLLLVSTAGLAQRQFIVPDVTGTRWWKGNTHTHTLMSDGDTSPDSVARWYKQHRYHFLVLSDHNVFTDPASLSGLVDSTFLLIPGEELTTSFASKPVHVNGLHIPHVLTPERDSTLVGTIQKNVDLVRSVRGVPHINHPNFRWAFDHEVLRHVRNDRLIEIYNGHPDVHNAGGGGKVSMEAMWDSLLSSGKHVYGIAVDDAHHFKGEFSRTRSNPGRGWISVRARRLEAHELMERLEAGDFYASTGVELAEVTIEPRQLTVVVALQRDHRYTIEFIGVGGEVLSTQAGPKATYALKGAERYVRARVTDSSGANAWVQPVWTTP
jgi:predicted metal-dependent phosphoesterase TrpH